MRSVFFSVIKGRTMTWSTVSAGILRLPRRSRGGTRPARHPLLFPGARFASIFGKPPEALHSWDCFLHDDHAIKFQNVPHIQISRVDNPDIGEIAGGLADR